MEENFVVFDRFGYDILVRFFSNERDITLKIEEAARNYNGSKDTDEIADELAVNEIMDKFKVKYEILDYSRIYI